VININFLYSPNATDFRRIIIQIYIIIMIIIKIIMKIYV
jgi:hypothetical protein